ncbi:uncharacterized protein ZBIST_3003 [Zygosaccharomyces bailii]|nr:uncharacterized protein ZBAI_08885 [Zygosaccharomyces bailii ISA1307]SJM86717.1 uncharacterized protein ZBIST_3003 [Zygosaccharomyces bailii]
MFGFRTLLHFENLVRWKTPSGVRSDFLGRAPPDVWELLSVISPLAGIRTGRQTVNRPGSGFCYPRVSVQEAIGVLSRLPTHGGHPRGKIVVLRVSHGTSWNFQLFEENRAYDRLGESKRAVRNSLF